jgi:hypothetical protein
MVILPSNAFPHLADSNIVADIWLPPVAPLTEIIYRDVTILLKWFCSFR